MRSIPTATLSAFGDIIPGYQDNMVFINCHKIRFIGQFTVLFGKNLGVAYGNELVFSKIQRVQQTVFGQLMNHTLNRFTGSADNGPDQFFFYCLRVRHVFKAS